MRFTIRHVDERGKEICEFWRWEIWQDPAGGTMRSIVPYKCFLGQYRIILSADTASKVRQMLSQKRR